MMYQNNLSKETVISIGTFILLCDLSGAAWGTLTGWSNGDWEDFWDFAADLMQGAVGWSLAGCIGTLYNNG